MVIDIPIRRMRNSTARLTGSCTDTAGFVRLSGRDTLSVESVSFTMNGLTDIQTYRDHSSQYTAVLTRDLTVFDAQLRRWTLGARMSGEPTERVDYRLRGDTAFFHDFAGPPYRLERQTVGPRLALLVDGVVGPDELVTRRAMRSREFTPAFPTLYLASGGYARWRTCFAALGLIHSRSASVTTTSSLICASIGRGESSTPTTERVTDRSSR